MNFRGIRALRQKFKEIITREYWRRRTLRRESQTVMSKGYWRRRERSAGRLNKILRFKYHTASSMSNLKTGLGIIRWAVIDTLKSAVVGALLLGATLAIETLLVRYAGFQFLQLKSTDSFDTFPELATQILAALLGFYLATVGIVLGNSYHDVSDSVRQLILRNAATKRYLKLVGMSIGVGLAIILLQSLQIMAFGYLSYGAYTILVAVSGWALGTLAIGAFNLLNPISLGDEPLRGLYRGISRLDSKGFHLDDAVLRVTASKADNDLNTLAELVRLTKDRKSVSRVELANMVALLLSELKIYAGKKHCLSPNSWWFLREAAYPRWVEAEYSTMSMALETSMPLEARQEPVPDWLERRAAALVSAAIEACAITEDDKQALLIIREVGLTTQVLAEVGRFDEAINFAGIIAEQCNDIDATGDTVNAVLADLPLVFANILMGWRKAADSWQEEIQNVIRTTKWDNPKTHVVQIRGPARMRQAAQMLLYQIHSEHRIEGKRITPDWYLHSVLAGEYIISIREFLDQFPERVGQVMGVGGVERLSPKFQAVRDVQSLQMLRRAEYIVVESLPQILADLEAAREGYDPIRVPEIESTAENIRTFRFVVLEELAKTLAKLEPNDSKDEPDYFGETLYRLTHQAEQAIAEGDVALVENIFPSILSATMKVHNYMLSTYRPPSYEITPGVLNPFLDILNLSGLAIIYEAIRGDQSAGPIRNAWQNWTNSSQHPRDRAKGLLDVLDLTTGGYDPMSIRRTEWEQRVARAIRKAGYARPEPAVFSFDEAPEWDAPPLIKMLNVSEYMPSIFLKPHVIFAAEVVSPLSGEDEQATQKRPGLRRYFETSNHRKAVDSSHNADANSYGSEGL